MNDRTLRLRDGRLLGYAEYGDMEGRPAFFFHGWLGSRLQARLASEVASRLGIRIISTDRPGFGLSDFKPSRTITDWPDDVSELADALKIDRFAVIGISGGGPYVLSCAFKIPQRITRAVIVSSIGPFDTQGIHGISQKKRLIFRLLFKNLWFMRFYLWLLHSNPGLFTSIMSSLLSAPDREVLSRLEIKQMLMEDLSETFRYGTRGAALEGIFYAQPWGFHLEEISTEVQLWQGEEDTIAPPSIGWYLAGVIPNCRATFCSKEGHYSLVFNHMEEILRRIL